MPTKKQQHDHPDNDEMQRRGEESIARDDAAASRREADSEPQPHDRPDDAPDGTGYGDRGNPPH
ncbi:MAG TPA: hypothetical protein VM600_03550 [Actinomycetota bacterium]|nr:hypothetical protein [Actinomycetota bacterium]